jgi:hypothetical protein
VSVQAQRDDVVRRLLVGAHRSGGDPSALLDACAAVGLAGFGASLPAVVESAELAAAPRSEERVVGEAARQVFTQIVAVDDQVLLTEWCGKARAAGEVAEHRSLPELLVLGTTHPGLRSAVAAVLGPRGRWLAGTRPGWAWATGTGVSADLVDLDEVLDLPGTQRLAALRRARRADLAGTRAFLAEQFAAQRRAVDRQVLVSAVEAGLGAEDEELLELALDDRAIGVHDEAVRLLRLLPGSALAARAAARLDHGLEATGGGLDVRVDGPWAEVLPDQEEARDLLRDGSEVGVAGRVRAAAASVPTTYWTDRLATDDEGAAEVLSTGPWAAALLRGVAQRLARAVDASPWAVAATRTLTGMEQLEMLASLPAELSARTVIAVSHQWNYDLLDHACSQLPAPWSAESTAALLDRYSAMRDPRWRAGRPPAVLLARGDAEVLGANWARITERWPEHSVELEVLRLRMKLSQAFDRKEPVL